MGTGNNCVPFLLKIYTLSSLVGLQTIAHAWLGNNEPRARWVGLNLMAQVADVYM